MGPSAMPIRRRGSDCVERRFRAGTTTWTAGLPYMFGKIPLGQQLWEPTYNHKPQQWNLMLQRAHPGTPAPQSQKKRE